MNQRYVRPARLFALTLLALTACRHHDFPQYPPNYREYAYVTNGDSGTVTILDAVNVRLDRELPVGQNPVAVAASPTRNEVYVVNSGAAGNQGSVSVINAENNSVAATIPVHRQPVSIELDPAGNLAYVANSGSNSISVLDLNARREIAVIRRRRRARLGPHLPRRQNPWSSPTAAATASASSTPPPTAFAPSSQAAPAHLTPSSFPTHPRPS